MKHPSFLIFLLPLMVGCPAHHSVSSAPTDVLTSLSPLPTPIAIQVRASLTVNAPRWKVAGTVPAILVLHRPQELWLQVLGPMGGLMLEAVATPQDLGILLASRRQLLTSADPDAALRLLTGDTVGVDGILCLLMGRLPPETWTVRSSTEEDGVASFQLELPEGRSLQVSASTRTSMLSSLDVLDPAGNALLHVAWSGRTRLEGRDYPEEVSLEVPGLELTARLRTTSWETLGEWGSLFQVRHPPSVEEMDLGEAIGQLGSPAIEGEGP